MPYSQQHTETKTKRNYKDYRRMARQYVKGIKEVQGYVNKRGREVNNEFRSELINDLRKVSRELQTGNQSGRSRGCSTVHW